MNYRRKGVYEEGTVGNASYNLRYASWSYDVEFVRRTPSKIDYFGKEVGNRRLTTRVSDNSVEPL